MNDESILHRLQQDGQSAPRVALKGTVRPENATARYDFLGEISVLLGGGDGTFGPEWRLRTGSWVNDIHASDFNGDGRPDLAIVHLLSDDVWVLPGNGDGTFELVLRYPVGEEPLYGLNATVVRAFISFFY